MQPGLRRWRPGAPQLTPLAPGRATSARSWRCSRPSPAKRCCSAKASTPAGIGHAVPAGGGRSIPQAFAWDGRRAAARLLGTAVEDGAVQQLAAGSFGLGDEVARPARGLALEWRLPGLLALAFAEDLAVIDGDDGTIPGWPSPCPPAGRRPKGRAPLRRGARAGGRQHAHREAADALARMVSGPDRWERSSERDAADAARCAPGAHRPAALGARRRRTRVLAHRAARPSSRWTARARPSSRSRSASRRWLSGAAGERSARLHDAIATMSDAVLAYRDLAPVRAELLTWLARGAEVGAVKTQPVVPAQIDATATPLRARLRRRYHPRVGALAQARHVFLAGNGLPDRWRGRPRFTVLATGFGPGQQLPRHLGCVARGPARCERLVFASVERHRRRAPTCPARAIGSPLAFTASWEPLAAAWPPLVPNLHGLDFAEGGRVRCWPSATWRPGPELGPGRRRDLSTASRPTATRRCGRWR